MLLLISYLTWLLIVFNMQSLQCSVILPLIDDGFQLRVKCVKNCNLANSTGNPILQASCTKCDGVNIKWTVSAAPTHGSRKRFGKAKDKLFRLAKSAVTGMDNVSVIASVSGTNVTSSYTFRRGGWAKSFACYNAQRPVNTNCFGLDFREPLIIKLTCLVSCPAVSEAKLYLSDRKTPKCILDKSCVTYQNFEDQSVEILFKANTFDPGDNFLLYYQPVDTQYDRIFAVMSTKGASISVSCRPGVESKCEYNNQKPIVLVARCSTNCSATEGYQYSWTISPGSDGLDIFGEDSNMLSIPKNSYADWQEIEIFVTKGPWAGHHQNLTIAGPKTTSLPSSTTIMYVTPTTTSLMTALSSDPMSPTPPQSPLPLPTHLTLTSLPSPEEARILEEVIGESPDALPKMIEVGKYQQVVEHSFHLLSELGNTGETSFRTHLLRHIVSDLASAAPHTSADLMLPSLLKAMEMEEVSDPITIAQVAYCLETVSQQLVSSQDPLQKDNDIPDLVIQLASEISNVSTHEETNLTTPAPQVQDYATYDDMSVSKIAYVEQERKLALSLTRVVRALGQLTHVPANDIGVLKSDNIFTSTQQLPRGAGANITSSEMTSSVQVSRELAHQLARTGEEMFIQLAVFRVNPFYWDETAKTINTEVIMINLFSGNKFISHMAADIDIYLEQTPTDQGVIRDELSMEELWRVHRVDLSAGSKMNVVFKVVDEEYFGIVSTEYPSLKETRYNGLKITKAAAPVQWAFNANTTLAYIGVARRLGKPLKYEVLVSGVSCLSWDASSWEWSSAGCKLGPATKGNVTHCQCDHLSLFGGSFLVPPNEISIFNELPLSMAFGRSVLVMTVVIVILIIWVALLVWAVRRDRALAHWGIHRFRDQVPGDSHQYLVGVVTGLWNNAGTTAHVAIQLLGRDAHSRVHMLLGAPLLQQGGEDWYVLLSPRHLGNIQAVRLFHDSYGRHPHWFCERVIVQDLEHHIHYVFICQKWLSLIWAGGEVDRLLLQSEKGKLRRGRVLFPQHAQTEIRDSHQWLSVFTRPPDSSFTSKERVTLAVAVLLLSLTASAMFYGVNDGLDPQGEFSVTTREVAIVIESMLITVPLGVIITLLFRKSRPKK